MKTLILSIVFFSILFAYLIYMSVRRKRAQSLTEENPSENTESSKDSSVAKDESDECCGQHAVCEKESLLSTKIKPDYYDDEELDAFMHRDPTSYSEDEIAQFQNVLYTMKEFDVAGWLKSLQLRQVELPEAVKEEALLIVSERRSAH